MAFKGTVYINVKLGLQFFLQRIFLYLKMFIIWYFINSMIYKHTVLFLNEIGRNECVSEVGQPVPPMLSSANESIEERKLLLSMLLSRAAASRQEVDESETWAEPEAKLGGGEADLGEMFSRIGSPIFVSVCAANSSFRACGLSTSADDSETSSQ